MRWIAPVLPSSPFPLLQQMAEWPFPLFLHLFLIFFLPHSFISSHSKCKHTNFDFCTAYFFFFSQFSSSFSVSHTLKSDSETWLQMVGLDTLETSSLIELFHQVGAGTHVCHTLNIFFMVKNLIVAKKIKKGIIRTIALIKMSRQYY